MGEGGKVTCEWCGAPVTPGSVCPWSVVCPRCRAKPGKKCMRPSEHEAERLHTARIEEAERRSTCPSTNSK